MKKIALIVASLFLISCSTVDKIETVAKPIEITPLNLPDPAPIEMQDIQWKVITEDNMKTVFAYLKSKKIDPVLFAVTDVDYENLSINFANIRNYIIKYRSLLKQYRMYYEGQKEDENDNSR